MSRGIRACTLALGLAALAAPAPSMGQDRVPAPQVDVRFSYGRASSARLGVYLEVGCEIEVNVRGTCEQAPRVRAVVDGSPAEAAGILAGDTLLTLDGVSLRSEPGRRSLSRLRAGIPIDIEVGRESGRSTLRAIPTPREGNVGVRVRSSDDNVLSLGPVPRAGFNVFRFRDDSGEIAEFQFGPESDGPPDASGWVVFSPDETGSLRVHVGEGGDASLMVDGESITLTNLEDHLVQLSENLNAGTQELELSVSLDKVGEAVRRHLILENPELAHRLERIRVESFAAAREQLELLVERRSELESRGEAPPSNAYAIRVRSPNTPQAERSRVGVAFSGAPTADHRLGGAEFRNLTPELAEYFDSDSGLLVLRVIPGTPFATLGLRGGDVVIEVGGRKNPDMPTFRHLMSAAGSQGVEVKWMRKGALLTGRLAGN